MKRSIRENVLTEVEAVREALIRAMQTLKAIPSSHYNTPQRIRSQWPDFVRGSGLATLSERRPIKAKATPEQISEMEHWLDLSMALEEECRRIVIARACRIPWRRLEEIDGRSHTTLRKIERRGLEELARHHEKH